MGGAIPGGLMADWVSAPWASWPDNQHSGCLPLAREGVHEWPYAQAVRAGGPHPSD